MSRIEELKASIAEHNRRYRNGNPTVSDEEYDEMLEELEALLDDSAEYQDFIDTLFEAAGGVKHDFVIGSLRKVKYEDNGIASFVTKIRAKKVLAQEKIDGMSFVVKYINGKYASAATRGDGFFGEDITDAVRLIVPPTVNRPGIFEARGELTLTGDDYLKLGYKNRRNGTVGAVPKLGAAFEPEKIKYVKAILYQILTSKHSRLQQLEELEAMGLTVPNYQIFYTCDTLNEDLKNFLIECRVKDVYDIDGLVICDEDYVMEDVKHPREMVAFKLNDEQKDTEVVGVELNVSKGSLVVPTIIVKPVDIRGVTVSRITGNNVYGPKGAVTLGLGVGAKIKIIRSGDVIPKIVAVLEPVPFPVPEFCPCCESKLVRAGAHIKCSNELCGDSSVMKVVHLLRKYGVEGASEVSLREWGIENLDQLIDFRPKPGMSKNASKFYDSLNSMLFAQIEPEELMGRMPTDGIGERTYAKITKYYGGMDKVTEALNRESVFANDDLKPEGIGVKTLQNLARTWSENCRLVNRIIADPRARIVEKKEVAPRTDTAITGKTFLFTGTLSKPRKHFEKLVVELGGILASGVNKDLNYLVVGEDAGSKLEKAEKLNNSGKAAITIADEDDFVKLIA